ncbi:MAG: protein kinase [Myxococcales bacterium]|nr:protein kinase [Myxococcales bacterium]
MHEDAAAAVDRGQLAADVPATGPEFPAGFGKYVLLREMARGGMGELFLAAAGEPLKLCVVKTLPAATADQDIRRRFFDEARVVVRLNHANLVQVFDVGTVDGELYLAMELVEGKDLRALWNRCAQLQRRIPVDVAVFVIREVLRGLAYVHEAMGLGLVHRDISPPNILVGYHGAVKLTDFGLAKSALRSEVTNPGRVFGRYNYLSPEQARGQPVDYRADIYAAGIVLWEMLTGRQLFPASQRSHAAALAAARNPRVRAPSELVDEIPDGLDAVVLRALTTERDQRYQTADRFRASLSEILARNFPACDTDRVGGFMRDIFARDHKFETQDYASYVREDFSRVREHGRSQATISLSDAMDTPRRGRRATSESRMADSQASLLSGSTSGNSTTREEAEQRWGTVIADRYRVEDLLVFDGSGALYRARDTERGVPCALRVLPEVYARDATIHERFARDARAAQELMHPNIAQVFDIGKLEDGAVYAVTELLADGQSLATIIQEEGRLSPPRAVHVATQVCRALGTAHEAGIIHRDFKPSNVMLVAQEGDLDFVKVVDFGIVSHVDSEPTTSVSQQELIVGSPDYMAPEQAAGAEANPASDIYALGVVLYEMLTGKRPYSGRNAIDILIQKGAHDAARVTDIQADVPEALADVVAWCLARLPEDRPASMRALEMDLIRALDTSAPRPVRSAVAAALANKRPTRPELVERSGTAPVPPPPEAGSSSSQRALGSSETSGVHDPLTVSGSGSERVVEASAPRAAVPVERREPSGLTPPPPQPPVAPRATIVEEAPPQQSHGWLWLVAGGTVVAALVLLRPQLFGLGASTPVVETKKPEPEPEPEPPPFDPNIKQVPDVPVVEPPPPSDDPAVIASRAELAAKEGRWALPKNDNLAEHLTRLAALQPDHEAIARLRKQAADALLARGKQHLDEKHPSDAAAAYRELLEVWPDNKDAVAPFTEALAAEGKLMRHLKTWDELLPLADELLKVSPKSFDGHFLRGLALTGLARHADAVAALKTATELKPKDKPAKDALAAAKKAAGGK